MRTMRATGGAKNTKMTACTALVGEITAFYIEPRWQGRGIGRQLMQKLIGSARSRGVTNLQVEADPGATGFYQAMNFKTIGQVPSGSIEGRCLPLKAAKIVY